MPRLLECDCTRFNACKVMTDAIMSCASTHERIKSMEFLSNLVILDTEEFLSGKHHSNGRKLAPYKGDYITIAQGGACGVAVLGLNGGLPSCKPPSSYSRSENDLLNYTRDILEIWACVERELLKRSQEELVVMGLAFVKHDDNGNIHVEYKGCADKETIIIQMANLRPLCGFFVEHGGCKMHKLIQKCIGTMAGSQPSPWRNFAHPALERSIFVHNNKMQKLMSSAVEEYKKLCSFTASDIQLSPLFY